MSSFKFGPAFKKPRKAFKMFKVRKPNGGYTNVPAVSKAQAKAIVAKVYHGAHQRELPSARPSDYPGVKPTMGTGRMPVRVVVLKYRALRYDELLRKGDEYRHPDTGRWRKVYDWERWSILELDLEYRRPIKRKRK